MSDLGLLLLAAGGSSRMGSAKQLLMIDGEPLIHRAARSAVDSGCRPIIVVLGAGHEILTPLLADLPVTPIVNPNWNRGIGTSIRAGIEIILSSYQATDGLVIMLADQPRISADVIRGLRTEHEQAGRAITVSSFGDAIGPPVIVNRDFFPALLSLPDDQCSKSIWQANPGRVHRAACP